MTEFYDKIVPPRYGPGRAYRQIFGPEEKEQPKPQPAPPPSRGSSGGRSGGSGGSGGSTPAPRPGPSGRTPRTPRRPGTRDGRSPSIQHRPDDTGPDRHQRNQQEDQQRQQERQQREEHRQWATDETLRGNPFAFLQPRPAPAPSQPPSGGGSSPRPAPTPGPRPAPIPPPGVGDRRFVEDVLSGNPFAGLPFSGFVGPDKDPSSDIAPINPHVKRWFDDMVKGAPKPTVKLPAITPGGPTAATSLLGHRVVVDAEAVPRVQYVDRELKARGLDKQFPFTQVGGYVNRDVRGRPGLKSSHAFGTAIDVNWQSYPLGSSKRQPQAVVDVFKQAGFAYGGDWRGRKDPHHYSLLRREGGKAGAIKAPVTQPKVVGRRVGNDVLAPGQSRMSAAERLLRGML